MLELLACAILIHAPQEPPPLPAPPIVAEGDTPTPRVESAITAIALLPDGTLLAGQANGEIVPLDPKTGQIAKVNEPLFARHPGGIFVFAVDPRGEFVAGTTKDGRVAIWPINVVSASGGVTYPGHHGTPTSILVPNPVTWQSVVQVEWTFDGSYCVTWSFDWLSGVSPTPVQIWTREGELVWTGPHARQVDVHPSELRIAAVIENEVLLGWPPESLKRIPLKGARDAVEFSPNGSQLAVGGLESTAWILEAKTGAIERRGNLSKIDTMGGHYNYINRLRWSPDGRRLGVVVGKGLKPGIVDPTDMSITWAGGLLGGRMYSIFDVAWTPGGELITGFGRVLTVDPVTKKQRLLVDGDEWGEVLPVGTEGEILLLASANLRRIDPKTGTVIWSR